MNGVEIRVPGLCKGRPIGPCAQRLLWLALALPAGFGLMLPAQALSGAGAVRGTASTVAPMAGAAPSEYSAFEQRRIVALNSERQKELVSDTDKLLKAIADLNAEVSHNTSDSFTPDQLRELEKIEKLARGVKDKMANPVQTSIFGDGMMSPGIPPVGIP